jgi:hypothetical protein
MLVFQARVPFKPLFPFCRGKKVIFITKKCIYLEKDGKKGHLINFLFFRKSGEHVGNMFFLGSQSTLSLGEFTGEEGDFI